ncbi:MAG: A24 family peptidase [Planctomycetaceae bacterium]
MNVFVQEHTTVIVVLLFAAGAFIGRGIECWSKWLCRQFRASQNYAPVDYPGFRLPLTELLTGVLFAGYFLAVFRCGAHTSDEVLPAHLWVYGRGVSHLILIGLLVAATATDFREYIVPDQITLTGIVLGTGIATVSGDTQMMHLWVDWNQAIPGLRGPFIPDWIPDHLHLHGLAWSVAGLLTGAGITWLVRFVSSIVLGQEALGFGDVTLMAMIGSFVGWQPVVFIFLLAPLCGLVAGLAAHFCSNRAYVPYGPYLALSTVGVLFGWRWLWMLEVPGAFSMRRFFGDAVGLSILAVISLAAFVLLLGSVRLYHAIPTGRPARETTPEDRDCTPPPPTEPAASADDQPQASEDCGD